MRISPSLISSRPAIIRSVVDLPQPEGPTSTISSPSRDLEVEVGDGSRPVGEDLADTAEGDRGHQPFTPAVKPRISCRCANR